MEDCIIKILFKDGQTTIWDKDKWDDCSYDGKAFVIKKDGSLVGLYAIDSVVSIVVKPVGETESVPIILGARPALRDTSNGIYAVLDCRLT